jgi:hypothetical protein
VAHGTWPDAPGRLVAVRNLLKDMSAFALE